MFMWLPMGHVALAASCAYAVEPRLFSCRASRWLAAYPLQFSLCLSEQHVIYHRMRLGWPQLSWAGSDCMMSSSGDTQGLSPQVLGLLRLGLKHVFERVHDSRRSTSRLCQMAGLEQDHSTCTRWFVCGVNPHARLVLSNQPKHNLLCSRAHLMHTVELHTTCMSP